MKISSFDDIAHLVKNERKRQSLTQTELAGLCGVGLRFIVDLEAGKKTAQVGKVLHVVLSLGLEIDIRNR